MLIKELPSLRESSTIETPSGHFYRWSTDEPDPADVPSGERHSSTMPGGYESSDATLPRKPGIDYADLERFSTWTRYDASGEIIGETRLERAPRVSGDQLAISPSAVGWQNHLEDDKSAREVYVDRDMTQWTEAPVDRRRVLAGGGVPQGRIPVAIGPGGIVWTPPNEALVTGERAEIWYDIGSGLAATALRFRAQRTGAFTNFETPTVFSTSAVSGAVSGGETVTFDDTIRLSSAFADNRYLVLRAMVSSNTTPAAGHEQSIDLLAVYGQHGLTQTAISGDAHGLLASDIVEDAVTRWAPLLNMESDSVEASTFVIPHVVFREPTTAGEIIRQVTRYGLQDWAVWDNREFVWHTRGARGNNWRARIGPSQLEETGPQADRLWNSVIVQYQDVDGSTRTVGPTGSGTDSTDADLEDDDPENPATLLGINRRALLTMGIATAASATEVGTRFLEEQKLLDTSGRATIVGYVEDDSGALFPYSRIKAGDTITFVDAADPSPRRIVRAEHSRESRSCTVDLDSPPEGLSALLERLGAVIEPLGL